MATKGERERLARALKDAQRRPGNRRCADCVEKAPNYCQLQFRTFICSNCAAVHREMFSPKVVKSVSMAEFTTDEVKAMRAGGNEAVWMSRWTSSDMEEPAAGCARVDLRRYLEEKYVRKRWTGSVDEQPTKVPTRQVPQVQPQPPQHAAAAPTSRPSIVRAPAITPQAQTRPAAHPTDKPKLQINMNRTVTQKPAAPAPLAPPTASLGSLRIGPPPGRQKLVPQPRQEASLKAQAPVTAADVIGSSSPNPFAQQSQAESLAPQASQTHVQNEPLEALDMFAEQAQAAPSTSQLQQPPQSNLFAAAPPQEDLFAVPSTKGDTFAIASPHVQPSDLSVTQQEQPLALASTDPFEAPITAAAPSTNPFAQPSPVGTNPFGKPNGGQAQAAALGPAQPVATPPMTPNVVISGAHQRQHFASPPPANTSQLAMTPRMPISMAGPSLTEGAAVMEEAANAAQFTTNEVALLDVGTKLEKIVVLSTYQGHATIRGKHDATREVDGTKLIKLAPNPTFSQNEDALYEIGGRIERCKIAEVHQDAPDEPPYYTIRLANSGRERTTDSPHLLKPFAVPGVASARGREADDDPFSDLGSGLPSTDSPASDTFDERVMYTVKGSQVPEPAVIVGVHYGAGFPPYYTIRLLSTNAERQTDTGRLSRAPPSVLQQQPQALFAQPPNKPQMGPVQAWPQPHEQMISPHQAGSLRPGGYPNWQQPPLPLFPQSYDAPQAQQSHPF